MGAGGLPTKQKAATNVGLVTQRPNNDDPDELGPNADETRGVSGGDGGGVGGGETGADASGGQRTGGAVSEDDYSQTLKIKAAQALFRMSLEPGGEVINFGNSNCKMISRRTVCLNINLPHVPRRHRLEGGAVCGSTVTHTCGRTKKIRKIADVSMGVPPFLGHEPHGKHILLPIQELKVY